MVSYEEDNLPWTSPYPVGSSPLEILQFHPLNKNHHHHVLKHLLSITFNFESE